MGNHWRGLVWVLLLGPGCSSTGGHGGATAPLAPVHGLSGVPTEYVAAFDALRAAVDAREDETARHILRRAVAMMESDLELFGDEMSSTERRGLDSAFVLAEGFERILDGRERIAALDLSLEPLPGDGQNQLFLTVRSRWHEALTVRPGPATVREELVCVTPLGRESRTVRYLTSEELQEFEVAADGVLRIPLARTPFGLPREALAAHWRWSLNLRAGAVLDSEGRYPAMHWGVAAATVTLRAGFLPQAPVEPSELTDYLERGSLTALPVERAMPPIMERAVRIADERRDEALALLKPIVERGTQEEIERMVPALRWLSRASSPGSDPLAWRQWLRTHGEAEVVQAPEAVDLPARRRR